MCLELAVSIRRKLPEEDEFPRVTYLTSPLPRNSGDAAVLKVYLYIPHVRRNFSRLYNGSVASPIPFFSTVKLRVDVEKNKRRHVLQFLRVLPG